MYDKDNVCKYSDRNNKDSVKNKQLTARERDKRDMQKSMRKLYNNGAVNSVPVNISNTIVK